MTLTYTQIFSPQIAPDPPESLDHPSLITWTIRPFPHSRHLALAPKMFQINKRPTLTTHTLGFARRGPRNRPESPAFTRGRPGQGRAFSGSFFPLVLLASNRGTVMLTSQRNFSPSFALDSPISGLFLLPSLVRLLPRSLHLEYCRKTPYAINEPPTLSPLQVLRPTTPWIFRDHSISLRSQG
jgi:hypothetical protein